MSKALITTSEHDLNFACFVVFVLFLCSASHFLFLLCLSVGLPAVVQMLPTVYHPVSLVQAAALASKTLVYMSGKYQLIF